MRRSAYCTTRPETKATATETRIAMIIERALALFMKSPKADIGRSPDQTLSAARVAVPPRSSKTIETVVEVGSPSELKTLMRRMSVTITAEKMTSTS